jgi:autotransporter-associated beta strand protein
MPYDSVSLGTNAAGVGVVNLDGGTLLTTYISKGAGSGTFNFNGGVLKSAAASETFMQGLTAANVKSGGAKVDTNTYDITIGQALLHDAGLGGTADGGLTKDGAGTLTLSGVNTYTGDTTVNEGTLVLADAEVAGQLKFIITGTGETTHSNKITGDGAVQLDGDFTFDMLAAGDTMGDTWTIVDNATLAETFSSTFMLVDFTGGEGAGVLWSKPITSSKIYEFSEATGILMVTLALGGDTNEDGVVDAVDYIALKTHFGVTEGATLAMGNFDAESDGNVDWDDLQILMANFGTRSVGGAPATPEPATLGLLAIGALALLRRRRTA